jgi:hypothetical protein
VLSPALCRANVFRDRSVTPNRPTRAALKWGTTSALALACPSIFSGAFIRETEPPLQSRAHFYDLIFQMWLALLPRSIFWNEIESSSRYSLARFLATALPDRGPQPRKHRPYLSKATVPYRTCKNTGIRPYHFTRELAPSRTVTLIYCLHLPNALAATRMDKRTRLTMDIRPQRDATWKFAS